jgi:murein DD-endopeptidase MepM/ murein hydrolase activator NlpD
MEIQRNVAGGVTDDPSVRSQPQWQDVPLDLPPLDLATVAAAVQQAAAASPKRPPEPAPPKDKAEVAVKAAGRKPSVRMVVTSGYGTRIHPITRRQSSHDGIDLSAPKGTPILASRSGKVSFAGEAGGYGLLVIVDHGQGVETRYAHASSLLVKVGQEVKAGQPIAKVGNTGRSTAPHLHFEIRRGGRTVDPWPLLAGGRSKAWRPPL